MLKNIFVNSEENRTRAFWRLLLQVFFYLVVAIILLSPTIFNEDIFSEKLEWVLDGIGVIASIWIAARFLDKRKFADLGLHLNKNWWIDLIFGLFLGGLAISFIFFVAQANGWVTVVGSFATLNPDTAFLPAIIGSGLLICFLAFLEELWFRGYQLINIAEGFKGKLIGSRTATLIAMLITAALFGLAHIFNPSATMISTLAVTMGGVILAIGFGITGELAIPTGFHIAWNFFQTGVFGFIVSGVEDLSTASILSTEIDGPAIWVGDAFGPESGLLAFFALSVSCLLIILWVRLRRGRAAILSSIAEYQIPESSEEDMTV